jgi:hypothetical protein
MDAIPNLKIGVQSQAFAQARSAYAKPKSLTSVPEAGPISDVLPLRAAQTTDRVELSSSLPTTPAGGRSLIAATVPGGVSFGPEAPTKSRAIANPSGVYAMYQVPGEKNAAATAVNVGRSLDVQG